MNSIHEMLVKLKIHPQVVGLVEFGTDHWADNFTCEDYDLLVILSQLDFPLNSIHFYVDGVPVDLNMRTIDYLQQVTCFSGFEKAFLACRIKNNIEASRWCLAR